LDIEVSMRRLVLVLVASSVLAACSESEPSEDASTRDATVGDAYMDLGYGPTECVGIDCDHHPGSSTGLTYGGGYFFASFGWGDNPARLFRSTNATEWTLAYDASGFSMAGVTWAGDRVVVGDHTPRHSTSLGESFVASAVPAYMTPGGEWANARQVGYAPVGGGRIMLLSGPGNGAWGDTTVSDDHGLTYGHPTTLPSECRGAAKPPVYGGGVWLQVWAGTGALCRSVDGGDTWTVTHITSPNNDLSNAVWTGSEFVLYQGTRGFRSDDGASFTEFESSESIGAVAFNPVTGTYVGVLGGWNTAYANQRVYRSADGVTWQTLGASAFERSHPITHVVLGYAAPSAMCPAP
jgi:hypothetical protein